MRFSIEPALTATLAIANDVGDGRQCLFRSPASASASANAVVKNGT